VLFRLLLVTFVLTLRLIVVVVPVVRLRCYSLRSTLFTVPHVVDFYVVRLPTLRLLCLVWFIVHCGLRLFIAFVVRFNLLLFVTLRCFVYVYVYVRFYVVVIGLRSLFV